MQLFWLLLPLFLLAFTSPQITASSSSQSPFQAFTTFIFTYYPGDPVVPVEEPGKRSYNNKPNPEPDHYYSRYIPFNVVKHVKQFPLDPRDIMLRSPCNIYADDITKQCLMEETNLFCSPDTRACGCFSWSALESGDYIHQFINEEDPTRYQSLHALGSYLRIEMSWNSDAHQCLSLNGSACFNPGSESLPKGSHYVACYPGLVCKEVLEDGMPISRCLSDQVPTSESLQLFSNQD